MELDDSCKDMPVLRGYPEGPWTVDELYYYYDGPVAYTARNPQGQRVVVTTLDDHRDQQEMELMVVPFSSAINTADHDGDYGLHSLFRAAIRETGHGFRVFEPYAEKAVRIEQVSAEAAELAACNGLQEGALEARDAAAENCDSPQFGS